jgi:uncharacterized phage protein (TIGR01671 family)
MNREIKFRAWDGSKMVYTEEDIYMKLFSDGSGSLWWDNKDGDDEQIVWFDKNRPPMQYTGLKDKNGKEIYEGDIIKWGHIKGGEENPIRVAVVKINPDLQFEIIGERKFFMGQDKVFRYGNFIYTDTEKWIEIIGNIYEHPHLLNSERDAQECDATGDK